MTNLTGGEALSCQMMRGCVSSGGTWSADTQRRSVSGALGDSISGVCQGGEEKAGQRSRAGS